MTTLPFGTIQSNVPFDPYSDLSNKELPRTPRVEDLTVALEEPPEIIETSLEPERAAKDLARTPAEAALLKMYEAGEAPEEAVRVLQETFEKDGFVVRQDDFYLEAGLSVNEPHLPPISQKFLTNQQIAFEVISERFETTEGEGFWSRAGDFADEAVRALTIGWWEGLTNQEQRAGQEIAYAASTMEPAEFKKWVRTYADDKASEGVFTSENFFRMMDAMGEVENSGFDPYGRLNQVLSGTDLIGIGIAKNALKAGSVITRAGAVKGVEGATAAAEVVAKTSLANAPRIQNELLPAIVSTGNGVRPNYTRVASIARENDLVQDIKYLYESGTFGRLAKPEEIEAYTNTVKTKLEENLDRSIMGVRHGTSTGLGDDVAIFTVGRKRNGLPFKSEDSAQKNASLMRSQGLSAQAVETQDGWVVEISQRLDLTKEAGPVDVLAATRTAFGDILGQFLGSTRSVDDEINNTYANMAENGQAAINGIVRPYLDRVTALKPDDQQAVSMVLRDLNSGPDAYIRDWYTEAEFVRKYKEHHRKGSSVTSANVSKAYDGYLALQSMNDVSYILEANRVMDSFVAKGFKAIDVPGTGAMNARVVSKAPKGEFIYNARANKAYLQDDVATEATVWELETPLEGDIRYVINPRQVRELEPQDVVGYNSGGPRRYRDNYYITLGGDAIMTSFTEANAIKAKTQINEILTTLRKVGRPLDELTNELDDVIRKNNDWNPEIENTSDFIQEAQDRNWSLRGQVDYKGDGQKMSDESLYAGLSVGDAIRSRRSRSDKPLPKYGGGLAETMNPIEGIVKQLNSTAQSYSYKNYNYRAKVSWLKAAGYADQLEKGSNPLTLFDDAMTKVGEITGKKGSTLRRLGEVIQRRDGLSDRVHESFSDFGQQVSEWVFDKSGAKTNLKDLNVTGTLLNLGFRSAFGFFNVAQFFLQSSHMVVIAAISPKSGFKAATSVLPMRLAMQAKGKSKDLAFKRIADFYGMSVDDVKEMERYLLTSGRTLTEADAIEKGTGAGFSVPSWEGRSMLPSAIRTSLHATSKALHKADKLALSAFNEGERLSRYTSMMTAFLEWKAKNPKLSALSDEGRLWIARREQDLSFNMTNSSRGMWQTGLMKVPTQWMSYSMRSFENLVLGRGFTKMERIRMGFAYLGMGGMAGTMVLTPAVDYVGEKLNVDPSSATFAGMEHGMFDFVMSYFLSEVTDSDIQTAFGSRLTPFSMITDIRQKVGEDSLASALAGPSGAIVGGGLGAVWGSISNLVNGHHQSSIEDLTRVARTASGVDNIYKAAQMYNLGTFTTKSGSLMPSDMKFSRAEALLQAAGITNLRVTDYYKMRTSMFNDDKKYRKYKREFGNDVRAAFRLYEQDPARAEQLLKEIYARIDLLNMSPANKVRLRLAIANSEGPTMAKALLYQARQGNEYAEKRVESMRGN